MTRWKGSHESLACVDNPELSDALRKHFPLYVDFFLARKIDTDERAVCLFFFEEFGSAEGVPKRLELLGETYVVYWKSLEEESALSLGGEDTQTHNKSTCIRQREWTSYEDARRIFEKLDMDIIFAFSAVKLSHFRVKGGRRIEEPCITFFVPFKGYLLEGTFLVPSCFIVEGTGRKVKTDVVQMGLPFSLV